MIHSRRNERIFLQILRGIGSVEGQVLSFSEHRSVYRILDASANRCREGLRVVEEYVRFHADSSGFTRELKTFRHDLQQTLAPLLLEQHIDCRDTTGDVGTEISLATERQRSSLSDLVQANCKRLTESLRTLEEYSKLLNPQVAAELEQLRYRFYDLEKRLLLASRNPREKLQRSALYLLINARSCRSGLEETVFQAAAVGVDIFQLRDKTAEDRQLLEQARLLRKWTRETGTLLIINDRPDLAILSEADGVHVGQEELTIKDIRALTGDRLLVGVSTHSLAQAEQAVREGADYLGVGPVFPSGTKQFPEFVGPELLESVMLAAQEQRISCPWFAIGGITAENVTAVVAAGTRRIAVSQAILGAEDVTEAVKILRKKLNFPGTEVPQQTSKNT